MHLSVDRPWVAMIAAAMVVGVAVTGAGIGDAQEIYAGAYPQKTGEELYQGICQGCHMPNAQGAVGAGAYPALAKDIRLAAGIYPLTVVLNGQRAMPPIGEDLTDEQVANVVNYIRTHFGNHYKDAVTPAAVKAARRVHEPAQEEM
jgi:mono/diheme cytochrome c family protein